MFIIIIILLYYSTLSVANMTCLGESEKLNANVLKLN